MKCSVYFVQTMMNVFMWQFSCVFCVDTVCHLVYDLPPYIGHVTSSVWSYGNLVTPVMILECCGIYLGWHYLLPT